MLPFQVLPPRRWRFDTTGEPLMVLPRYDPFLAAYWPFEEASGDRASVIGSMVLTPFSGADPAVYPTRITGKENYGAQCTRTDLSGFIGSTVTSPTSVLMAGWFKVGEYWDISTTMGLFNIGGLFGVEAKYQNALGSGLSWYDNGVGEAGSIALGMLDGFWQHAGFYVDDYAFYCGANGTILFSAPAVSPLSSAAPGVNTNCSGGPGNVSFDELAMWVDLPHLGEDDFARIMAALYNSYNGTFFDGTDWYEVI